MLFAFKVLCQTHQGCRRLFILCSKHGLTMSASKGCSMYIPFTCTRWAALGPPVLQQAAIMQGQHEWTKIEWTWTKALSLCSAQRDKALLSSL